MAGLLAQAIVFACAGSVGAYNAACNKAMDAGTRQVGIRQEIDSVEDKTVEWGATAVQRAVGHETFSFLGAGGFVYKTVRNKSLAFRLPTLGLCNSVNNEVSPDSYKMTLEWKF